MAIKILLAALVAGVGVTSVGFGGKVVENKSVGGTTPSGQQTTGGGQTS